MDYWSPWQLSEGYIYIETKIIEIQNYLYKIPIVSINETKKQKQDMATKETHCCQGDKPLVTKEETHCCHGNN